MQHIYTTPTSSRVVSRSGVIDGALVADARTLLERALTDLDPDGQLDRVALRGVITPPMAALCLRASADGVAVEKLIVALKLAWGSIPNGHRRFGESAPDALSCVVTICIEEYFQGVPRVRSD